MVMWFPQVAARYVIFTSNVVSLPVHVLLVYKVDSPHINKPNINFIEGF
jgi:hypothetical protein